MTANGQGYKICTV